MKSRRDCIGGSMALSLLLVTSAALAGESAPTYEFTYSDDWAVVSAPPPPGPYRAVNIDPRVPGGDAIPPISMEAGTTPARGDMPDEAAATPSGKDIPAAAMTAAPAAGMPPATRLPEAGPVSALGAQPSAPSIMPGRAERVAPSQPGYYYPAPPRYPAQTTSVPPSGYPGYRNQPAYGYYGSPVYPQRQQQVPPPPVYDSSIRNPPPYGHPSGRGTP